MAKLEQPIKTRLSIMQEISQFTWDGKYRFKKPNGTSNEQTIVDTHKRVCKGVYVKDKPQFRKEAEDAMIMLAWCPAGRNHAGAGTGKRVTLINCFVSTKIQDSMETIPDEDGLGILDALKAAALTQQMGGGIGMDFSTLRPNGAEVKRVGSVSSGPLHFMDMWDAMCRCIMSSGSRRGAMMGVMSCTHPDILSFINAKHEAGRLTMFNVSVLVTDDFMQAVKNDKEWNLYFNVPRPNNKHKTFKDKDGETQYIYETVRAKELWDTIIKSTYEYAEPGVIFIDRINKWNNLWYCEDIRATNPCGEQPLPPDNVCNLGAVNLAVMVDDPFGESPTFNFDMLIDVVRIGVRFLDNVLDVTLYPLERQKHEALAKRRIGLGITGLGNMLQQMKLKYGSVESVDLVRKVMMTIRDEAYKASVELAKERGPFPAFDKEKFLEGKFIKTLPKDIQKDIEKYGIRNGVLLTIAPTGTTSIYYNNISSGLEPSFDWTYDRRVLLSDGSFKKFTNVEDYGYRLFKQVHPDVDINNMPDYMVTALELSVEEHLSLQAVCQEYVDASISKTINCPESMSFDEFKKVYYTAYDRGCKGCTTYRPSGVRGAVLSKAGSNGSTRLERPETLTGKTYKAKWPSIEQALYVTINDFVDEENITRPFEIFINSKSVKHQEWVTALTRTMSAVFRKGGDVAFLCEELEQVYSSSDAQWVDKKLTPSIPAMIGHILRSHMQTIGYLPSDKSIIESTKEDLPLGEICPKCNKPHLISMEGCSTCYNCGHSNCG